jgi:3,5-dihydroxyphenylacetyl-CoA synthase
VIKNRDCLAQIVSVGTAVPAERYAQRVLADYFSLREPKILRFFNHPHIQFRHLILPPRDSQTGDAKEESTGLLLEKFRREALKIGHQAMTKALSQANLSVKDIDFLGCVTSTGFIVPGLSARFFHEFGFRDDCQRADVVGMGCNAGLNGLNVVASWCAAHPNRKALLVCVEICSAIYSVDASESSALVNSLFADGAAAAVMTHPSEGEFRPSVQGFVSHFIPNSMGALRFDWDDEKHRYRFFVGKETPKMLAAHIEAPVGRLLKMFDLQREQIQHWIVHSGGSAILDAIESKLSLEKTALRHTRSVLRDFGNISSGSFLFSYDSLLKENRVQAGDRGVIITMGPGLTIETALVRF